MGNLERRAEKRQGGRGRARREKGRRGKKGKRRAMKGAKEGEREEGAEREKGAEHQSCDNGGQLLGKRLTERASPCGEGRQTGRDQTETTLQVQVQFHQGQ